MGDIVSLAVAGSGAPRRILPDDSLELQGKRIGGLGAGVAPGDAVNKQQMESALGPYGEATVGAAGAVTLVPAGSVGIASIVKGANDGLYDIVLTKHVSRIRGIHVTFIGIGDGQPTGVPAAPIANILTRTTNTLSVQLSPVNEGAQPYPWWVNPADGETMAFQIFVTP